MVASGRSWRLWRRVDVVVGMAIALLAASLLYSSSLTPARRRPQPEGTASRASIKHEYFKETGVSLPVASKEGGSAILEGTGAVEGDGDRVDASSTSSMLAAEEEERASANAWRDLRWSRVYPRAPEAVARARLQREAAWLDGDAGGTALVVFNYMRRTGPFETEQAALADKLAGENLDRFLKLGVGDNDRVHYILMVVGDTEMPMQLQRLIDMQRSDDTKLRNVLVSRIPAGGSDLCQYGRLILQLTQDGPEAVITAAVEHSEWLSDAKSVPISLRKRYDHYAFVNEGARGPYLGECSPSGRTGNFGDLAEQECASLPGDAWVARFISLIDNSTNTGWVGPYVSCEESKHVQTSTALGTHDVTVSLAPLWEHVCGRRHDTVIKMGEVAGSRGLLTSGVNLASMQPWLAGVDLRRPPGSNAPCNDPDLPGGPFVCYPEQHQQFGCLPVDPFELMFVKMGGAPVREGHFTPGLVQCARALDDGAECEYERRLR